ncbi:MAG: hypothetical protein O2955_21475 [Planctomycetota bacterium]|nr:hypothetical protein [Planctomycetota bacterium]MDA1215079.1 hypothetical protein [Planctomycetota bacterium]
MVDIREWRQKQKRSQYQAQDEFERWVKANWLKLLFIAAVIWGLSSGVAYLYFEYAAERFGHHPTESERFWGISMVGILGNSIAAVVWNFFSNDPKLKCPVCGGTLEFARSTEKDIREHQVGEYVVSHRDMVGDRCRKCGIFIPENL